MRNHMKWIKFTLDTHTDAVDLLSYMLDEIGVEGIEMAVEGINAAGGIAGRPIEIIKEDEENDPTTAVSVVNKLINQNEVVAIIGSVNSSVTLAAMEVSEDAGIPMVTPSLP